MGDPSTPPSQGANQSGGSSYCPSQVSPFLSSPNLSPHPSVNDGPVDFSDFPRAVRVALHSSLGGQSPVAQSAVILRHEAEAYLSRLESHPAVWDFAQSILAREVSENVETFWCCNVLLNQIAHGKYETLCEEDKQAHEQNLLKWARTTCPVLPLPANRFVLNKFAQLMVLTLIHSGYPSRWGSFFDDLFGMLSLGEPVIELWLRILEAVDNLVVCRDSQRTHSDRTRSMTIKDHMRGTCITQVANTWYHILASYQESRPDLARLCMKTMCPYMEWIDIGLVSSPQWVNMLYHFLRNEALQQEAVACLVELSEKKIADPAAKLDLITTLKVTEAMPGVVAQLMKHHEAKLYPGEDACDDDGTSFFSRVSDLVLAVGVELVDVLGTLLVSGGPNEVAGRALGMLNECLPMLWQLLGYGSSDVSARVCEFFVRKYVELLKRQPEEVLPRVQLSQLLEIIAMRVSYHPRYQFDNPSDYETMVEHLRKQLLVVFKNIATLNRDHVSEWVADKINSMVAAVDAGSAGWNHVEAVLRLWYSLGEDTANKGPLFKQPQSLHSQVMTKLVHSSIASAGVHQSVAIAYLDCLERYNLYFANCEEPIPLLLSQILGPAGVSHSSPKVRAKACSVFANLAKVMRHLFLPCIDAIASSVQRLLNEQIDVNERNVLYEVLGVLIAPVTGDSPQKYLQIFVDPLIAGLKAATQHPSDGVEVSNTVMYLAYLSKGFSGLSAPTMGRVPPAIEQLWCKVTEEVLMVVSCYHSRQEVRDKTLQYTHRMIDLLGSGVIQYIVPLVQGLLPTCDLNDLAKLVRIPTQLLQRLKAEAVPHVDQFFATLIQRIFQVTDVAWMERVQPRLGYSEQAREHLDLLRSYFSLLIQVSQGECIHLFLTERSRPHLENVLHTLAKGCVSNPELEFAKPCYQILWKMASAWCGSVAGFNEFLAGQVLPMTVHTVKQPHFVLTDAKCMQVMTEIGQLYVTFGKSSPDAFGGLLMQHWGMTMEQAGTVVNACGSGEAKAVRDLLKSYILSMRQ